MSELHTLTTHYISRVLARIQPQLICIPPLLLFSNYRYSSCDSLEYSLAFSHNSYSYPLLLSSRTLPTCTCTCSTNHPGPFQPRRATHAHSPQDADPRRAEALRWLLCRLCHRLVRLPRQEQRHGRARYLGQKGVSSSPTPSLDSYKLLAHFTHRATHCYLATAIPIRLHVAKRQPYANPVRTSAHLLTQVPLVRYADWGISIPLMLYQLCDLGGAAAC